MIVLRVRGKNVRSVLYNIVCNNCAQCSAHTYEQTNSSLDWVLYHWAHFTVLRFIFMVALCSRADHYIFMLFLLLLLLLSFFSSPNLSGWRLDVYHTLAHGVALVTI